MPARAGLTVAVLAYAAYVSRTTLSIHYAFGTPGFDLGIFDQGVWLLSRFENPFVTVRGLHLFGDHTSFLLVAFVPLYWIVPSPAVLLVTQSLAIAAGAIPAFLIAREKLRSEWIALACAGAYLAHPAVASINFENFHPDSLEMPLILFAFYFMLKSRWRWFMVCIGAVLLIKEDVPLLTFALGLYVAVRHDRRVGVATAAISVLWFAAAFFVVLPAFNDVGSLYASRLPTEHFGGSGGMLKMLVLKPWEIFALALGPEQRWYVWQLLASFGLLSCLVPATLLIAVIALGANLLSTFPYQYQLAYHYSTLIVPVLVVSAIFGIARARSMQVRAVLSGWMLITSVTGAYLWGPMGRHPRVPPESDSRQAHAARRALAIVPHDAGVSAIWSYVPHLTHREQIYEFPNPWRAANWGNATQEGDRLPAAEGIDYVLVGTSSRDHPEHGPVVRRLEQTEFDTLFESEGVLLLVREGIRERTG